MESIQADPYWPKWNSPWWHMLLLHEMNLAKEIPKNFIAAYVEAINRLPVKVFPLHAHQIPAGVDPYRGVPCHCQLGNLYQVLSACGVYVDMHVPWLRPWLLGHQMEDGGLNCDSEAYSVEGETPSSMVATIAAFEAILLHTNRPWTPEEKIFLDKCAHFLIERKLSLGSTSAHNASERASAQKWSQLCFPRFYFYDVLRGLSVLLKWSERTAELIPNSAIFEVVSDLEKRFPGEKVNIGRRVVDGVVTLHRTSSEGWQLQPSADSFPLLEKVSQVGAVSPFLSREWREAKNQIHV